MNVHTLIDEAEQTVPDHAPVGARHRAEGVVSLGNVAHAVAVAARIDAAGRRRDQYFCDGIRVPRPVLLRLTCAETECPQALAVRAQWSAFHRGRLSPQATRAHADPPAQALVGEFAVGASGQRCVARSARFRCFIACPNRAHPALWMVKSGFDVFENGNCVAGGVLATGSTCRPRLPSLQSVEAYLLARQLQTAAVLGAVANRGTRSDG